MGWQPETQPKGKPQKIIYLCDREKECNKHGECGRNCKHTADIMHAVNFINLGDGNYVEERPTIDAEPVRHGKWIKADSQQYFRKHYPCFNCSECGYRKDSQKKWNYCPNCGADMRGEE